MITMSARSVALHVQGVVAPAIRGFRWLLTVALLGALPLAGFAQSGSYDWGTAAPLGNYPGILRAQSGSVNCLRIDLTTPNLRLFTTGRAPCWADNSAETVYATATDFITQSQSTGQKVVAAINADAFSGGAKCGRRITTANLRAYNVSEGLKISSGNIGGNAATLIVDPAGAASMQLTSATSEPNLSQVNLAVSGFSFVLVSGLPQGDNVTTALRTGLGLSPDGRYVYFLTCGSSTTQYAAGDWLRYFGAYQGINMDGGGSTQMAWWNPATSRAEFIMSSSRAVGNNIGVYYDGTGSNPDVLPAPWSTADIGAVGIAGAASLSNGVFTVTGSGSGIGGTSDQFRYAYQALSGDGSITARLVGQSGTGASALAGVMIRETTGTKSRYALMARQGNASVIARWREKTTGQSSSSTITSSPLTPPNCWVRLVRTGNSIEMSSSSDGTNWTVVHTGSISMASQITIGLVVTSGSNTVLDTDLFDNVTVVP